MSREYGREQFRAKEKTKKRENLDANWAVTRRVELDV